MRARYYVAAALAIASGGCDPCAGTPSCHLTPELSYFGEFIERQSGAAVSGVRVVFVRHSGVDLVSDTATATTDANGFFQLRMGAYEEGAVNGEFQMFPPPPYAPYVVRGVRLYATRTRGDGGVSGRFVANPYLQLLGFITDRKTGTAVAGASILVTEIGEQRLVVPTARLSTAPNGSFLWEPAVSKFGELHVEFEISAPVYSAPFRIRRLIALQYLDGPPRIIHMSLTRSLSYIGDVIRRGNGERVPGTTVEFVRRGGVMIDPDSIVVPVNGSQFWIRAEPTQSGVVIGDLTIRPPAPLPAETLMNVQLLTDDIDTTRYLGFLGFGPGVLFRREYRYRATGAPIRAGTHARVTHVSGLPLVLPPGVVPASDSGIRAVDEDGVLTYTAATGDTGEVVFDIELRLNVPHRWETLTGIRARARQDSSPSFTDTVRVGSWFPWRGEVRDAASGAAMPGVSIAFRATRGASIRPAILNTITGSDGSFRLNPLPLGKGNVIGNLYIRGGGAFRDTMIANVTLVPFQDDSIRSLGVFRLNRM